MRAALLIVLSACLSLHAQVFQSPASFISLSSTTIKPPPTPTTLSGGEVPLVWFQGILGTNSSVLTITNLASSGSGYNLTNSGASSTWFIGGQTVNGKPSAYTVTSSRYLKSDAFTNGQASGFVIGMVISVTNIGLSYISASTNTSTIGGFRVNTGSLQYYDGSTGTTLCSLDGITNSPISLILVAPANGANQFSPNLTLYTNGVSAGTVGTNPATYMQGLLLGNRSNLGTGASFLFCDFEIYKSLSAGSITELHTYHHNTFGVP